MSSAMFILTLAAAALGVIIFAVFLIVIVDQVGKLVTNNPVGALVAVAAAVAFAWGILVAWRYCR